MGILLNGPAFDLNLPDLLVQLDIVPELERIRLPRKVGQIAGSESRAARSKSAAASCCTRRFLHRPVDLADRRQRLR